MPLLSRDHKNGYCPWRWENYTPSRLKLVLEVMRSSGAAISWPRVHCCWKSEANHKPSSQGSYWRQWVSTNDVSSPKVLSCVIDLSTSLHDLLEAPPFCVGHPAYVCAWPWASCEAPPRSSSPDFALRLGLCSLLSSFLFLFPHLHNEWNCTFLTIYIWMF